jgi:hypothetical protein
LTLLDLGFRLWWGYRWKGRERRRAVEEMAIERLWREQVMRIVWAREERRGMKGMRGEGEGGESGGGERDKGLEVGDCGREIGRRRRWR